MRFTIRDLLWLTLLAAVLVAWWVDRSSLVARVDELENRSHFETVIDEFDRLMKSQAPTPIPPKK
jgi:hypothetical protein